MKRKKAKIETAPLILKIKIGTSSYIQFFLKIRAKSGPVPSKCWELYNRGLPLEPGNRPTLVWTLNWSRHKLGTSDLIPEIICLHRNKGKKMLYLCNFLCHLNYGLLWWMIRGLLKTIYLQTSKQKCVCKHQTAKLKERKPKKYL